VTSVFYRIYLRANHRIVCRQEVAAANDDEARRIAALLAEAASDMCDSFELWQGGRVVTGPDGAFGNGHNWLPAGIRTRTIVAAEAILGSGWEVAQSRRLVSQLAGWQRATDARLLDRLIQEAVAATGADTGNIQLHDGMGHLHIAAQHGLGREFLDYFAIVTVEGTSCGQALKSSARVVVEDVPTDPIFRDKPAGAMLLRTGLRSTHSTPIMVDGRVRGMISTHRRINWRPNAEELRAIDRFAADAATVIGS
jgi:hypothetical protein